MLINIRKCGLSLEDYARITGLDPCMFVGLQTVGTCPPFDCERRKIFLAARDMAQSMIERAADAKLCDEETSLVVIQPYFKRDKDFDPVITWSLEATGEVTYAETDYLCQRLATVEIVLDPETAPLLCDTLEAIEVIWPACECPRFAPDWCNVSYNEETFTLTAQTPAFTLVDATAETQDAYGHVTFPKIDDDTIYVDEVTILLRFTRPRDKAVSVWADPCCMNTEPPEDPCESNCCPDVEKEHCFKVVDHLIVLEPSQDCRCTCFGTPKFYRLDGLRRGIWKPEMAEAVVSLMNNLLPQSYCSCNEVSAMRFKRDTFIGDRDISANYINPFGVLTPGGYMAWRIVSNVLWGDVVVGSL